MPKESNQSNAQIAQYVERARDLLDHALALIGNSEGLRTVAKKTAITRVRGNSRSLDFSMPIRAFVKRYGAKMNGSKKFTLLVAYLTKGDAGTKVKLAEIERHWNRMTSKGLLGMRFNRLYTSQARENDWANATETGSYHLRPAWKEIFQ